MKIKDIKFDKEVYPRENYSWQTAYQYQQAMKSGIKFPPITVGLYRRKYILIDGMHRLVAYKWLKEKYISAEIKKGLSKKDMFILAVKLNSVNARPFSVYERALIITRLEKYKISPKVISKLVAVPINDLQRFKADRITYSTAGEKVVLKSAVKHLSKKEIENPAVLENLQDTYSSTQLKLLNELISLIKNNLIDKNNPKIISKLIELEKHLKSFLKK
ncbi:MAG: ParB N-terminal domain-containing protein [Methanosarcinales archaeon]